MTRTQAGALRVALGILRAGGAVSAALPVLHHGPRGFRDAVHQAWLSAEGPPLRVLRVRVCLAIRAVLRAERGDSGSFARFVECRDGAEVWSCGLSRMRSAIASAATSNRADAAEGRTHRAHFARLARPLWCFDDDDHEAQRKAQR